MRQFNDYLREKQTILIVDDNNKNLQILGSILKENAYQVAAAKDGDSAIKLADKLMPDLVLLDVMMPGMNGFETCVKLKNMEKTNGIPVIFLSARGETTDIVNGFTAGGVDYITKPFIKEELLARIRTHLIIRNTEKELKELVEAKDKFFSIIAHDLKNPISSLVALIDLLHENLNKYDKDKIEKMIAGISEAAQAQYKLQENLLEWSRLQTNSLRINRVRFNLVEAINEAIDASTVSSLSKEVNLNYDGDSNIVVNADKNMMDTVLRNLISNAIKFSFSGNEVKVIARQMKQMVEVKVVDNGMGIKPDNMESIFKLKSGTTPGTKKEKGTGLGLVVCKEFIEKNDGEIWVSSVEGKGATFTFTLPLDN